MDGGLGQVFGRAQVGKVFQGSKSKVNDTNAHTEQRD